jgi:acetyltransferase-like isoleucine patch superfamily enzyme
MSDFSSIAPGVTTGGNISIGKFSAVSLGANVIHGIKIGKHSVIGSGSTVLTNIDDYVVAYGTPAKIIRERKDGDKYL